MRTKVLHRATGERTLAVAFEPGDEVMKGLEDVAKTEGVTAAHFTTAIGTRWLRADGTTRGGHLLEAWVQPTLEVVVVESPAHLQRRTDPKTGLPLLDLTQ